MPTVPIVRTAWGVTRKNTMGLKVENEPVISLITTPPAITGTPGVWSISETPRPGMAPITQVSAPGLRTMRMEHKVGSLNPNLSIEHLLAPFRTAAEKGKRVQFIGGGWLVTGKWWLIESMDIAEDLKAADNRTSRATLTWVCKEANTVSAVELTKTGVKRGTVTRVPAGGTFIPGVR